MLGLPALPVKQATLVALGIGMVIAMQLIALALMRRGLEADFIQVSHLRGRSGLVVLVGGF